MKRLLRHYIIETVALYLINRATSGLIFEKGMESLLLAGLGLTLTTLLVRPLINVLLLPLNLITFGLFKWLGSAIALYLVTMVVPGFRIGHFFFAGLSTKWLDIPTISFQGIAAIIAFSFLLSLITSLLHWLFK